MSRVQNTHCGGEVVSNRSFRDHSRVLIVCISLRAGGTERVVSMLANHLAISCDVEILTLSDVEPFYEVNPRVRIRSYRRRGRGLGRIPYYAGAARFIRSTFKAHRSDAVLSCGETINGFVRLALVGLRARIFLYNQGTPDRSLEGLAGLINPIIYSGAERLILQTETSRRLLSPKYRSCKTIVIPNPVEIPTKTFPMANRRRIIINVGSLGRLKNQEFLLKTFAGLPDNTQWILRFVGDGPDRARLQDRAVMLGVAKNVEFLGQREDVDALLSESQVFAFTSLSEGLPNALAEALAHGCACISFDCPTGPSDLIEHDDNGILVKLGEDREYAVQLGRLMRNEQLRARLGKRASKSMQRYAAGAVLQQFENVLLGRESP